MNLVGRLHWVCLGVPLFIWKHLVLLIKADLSSKSRKAVVCLMENVDMSGTRVK